MKRLKVLFVTNWYPTQKEPAKAIWVREQAKAAELYNDVVVLHCAGFDTSLSGLWRIEKESDANLGEGIPTWRMWYRPSFIPATSYPIYFWSVLRGCRYIGRQGFRPDLIHVHIYDAGAPAVAFGKLKGIPVVVSEHFSSFPRRTLGRLDLCKAWLAFRWADVVIPASHFLQEAIEHYGFRARFEVIPNVADITLFFPAPGPRNGDSRDKRILFVGQLTPVKGIPFLFRALSQLRRKRNDWRLDIVGDGHSRMKYERLAADLKLGDAVAFHGLKSRREVAEFMRQADLFVLSSLTETFSVPAAEALASGIPVLSTRCGGPQEFLGEDTGGLVASGDADALFKGLDCLLDNLHRYSHDWIYQYARERFSPECVGAKLHALYQSLTVDAG
ncbi:MAG TPA: glycosyltransferase [Candidatus Binataceae bacterium]|nr:glycosyltransferase [Candidatus Binataceae bacterium]